MRRTRLRGAAWLAALAMIGVACSGAPQDASDAEQVAIDNEPAGGDTGEDPTTDSTAVEDDTTTDGEVGDATTAGDTADGDGSGGDGADGTAPGDATAGGGDGDTSGSDGGTATTGDATTGTDGGGSTSTDGGATDGSSAPTGPYSAERASIGISEDEIYMCGHAALIFAEAFDIRAEDLNVYWEDVNSKGGVHGRKVRIDWEDDQYNGNQAITAAQTCNSRDPFVLLGGIGFDQIPGVRTWAENNAVPYIHHIAVEPKANPTHSFSFLPSVEKLGLAFGEYISSRHGGKKVGIISRESENWSPGHDAGVAEMERRNVEIVHDFETSSGQTAYQNEIFQMQSSGVEVVWVWENALAAGEIIAQANQQQYYPIWVVFPFQTTLDVATPPSPVEGVSTWPAYAPGGFGENDPVGHNADIAGYEAAFAKHRPNTEPNYLLYITWVGHKAMHQLLLDCGPDCDRNRLHSMLTSGYKASPSADPLWQPNCGVDFGWSGSYGGHYGGFSFYAQQVYDHGDGTKRFKTTDYCWQRFG